MSRPSSAHTAKPLPPPVALRAATSPASGGGEKEVDPATPLELARRLYEQSPMPVASIAALFAVHERSIYRLAKRQGWTPRKSEIARHDDGRFARRFLPATAELGDAGALAAGLVAWTPDELAARRAQAVAELWREASAELAALEAREQETAADKVILERARALESLTRTFRTLQALHRPRARPPLRGRTAGERWQLEYDQAAGGALGQQVERRVLAASREPDFDKHLGHSAAAGTPPAPPAPSPEVQALLAADPDLERRIMAKVEEFERARAAKNPDAC